MQADSPVQAFPRGCQGVDPPWRQGLRERSVQVNGQQNKGEGRWVEGSLRNANFCIKH
jgi:hypothetical protein